MGGLPLKGESCTLTIAAAADLSSLEQPLSQLLPDCKTRWTFAASGVLAQQIEHGAPYDIFFSANASFVRNLEKAGLTETNSVHTYAYGQLALWSKRGLHWRDLVSGRIDRISIANPTLAPYGLAARQALEHEQLWRKVEAKVVFGENVRQALQYAETGNVDACLTAYSLVKDRGGEVVPSSWYQPISQTVAIIKRTGGNLAAASRFLTRLESPEGQKVLADHGLLPAGTGKKN